jgi:hypothetical protein
VNSPWIFSKIWGAISMMIDPRTVAKMSILSKGPEQTKALERDLGLEDLPDFLGGGYKGGWDGNSLTPFSKQAIDPADRNRVREHSVNIQGTFSEHSVNIQ